LRPLQGLFPQEDYPDLLVGLGSPDDAAVWRLNDEQALVVTVDFFTPVVDTPYEYGVIAAANALSDLYAMGAKPLFALNVAAMPVNLPAEVIAEIMRGGADKVREAGAAIAGGHTVQDEEPKYGLVAIGLAQHESLITKANAKVGDLLVLTKPLGTGVTTTALKNGACAAEDLIQVVEWMSRLNRDAAEMAVASGITAGTDITGFGFLGHALELAQASEVGLKLWLSSVPFFQGALGYAKQGHFPGGSNDNKLFFGGRVQFETGIDEYRQMLLFDAQTSGGLLLAIRPEMVDRFLTAAKEKNQPAWLVGEVIAGEAIEVTQAMPQNIPESMQEHPNLMFFK
jgi:selenide,water dikinase